MFQEWDFLLAEIWGLLALAALLGLIVGWLIWGTRRSSGRVADPAVTVAETVRLKAALETCTAERNRALAKISALGAELVAARATPTPVEAAEARVAAPVASVATEARAPARLAAARNDAPDDLKLIKGIGPKMEALCHRLGFYHFDQIAAWTPAELAWVDDNLEDFKGRASRDNWIGQARALAAPKA